MFPALSPCLTVMLNVSFMTVTPKGTHLNNTCLLTSTLAHLVLKEVGAYLCNAIKEDLADTLPAYRKHDL